MAGRSIRELVAKLVMSLLLLLNAACVGYGNVGTVTRTIDRGNAENLMASFAIGDGQVDIAGGADALMEANFTTNDKLTPEVNYSVNDGSGSLVVSQPSKTAGFNVGPITNHWSLHLNDDVPVGLSVKTKSARASLSLDTLTVKMLDVTSDSGDANVSLSGAQNQLGSVSLRSTSGSIHLTLDGDYRVPATIHVDSSSGGITVDLNGKWAGDVSGTFKSDSSSITITVPKDAGVRISASTDSGYVNAAGFTDRGQGVYLNKTAITATTTMRLDVQSSSGNITIHTGDAG